MIRVESRLNNFKAHVKSCYSGIHYNELCKPKKKGGAAKKEGREKKLMCLSAHSEEVNANNITLPKVVDVEDMAPILIMISSLRTRL